MKRKHIEKRSRYAVDLKATLLLIGFAVFLGIPAIVSIGTDHSARSRWERRPLATFPDKHVTLTTIETFFSQFDAFLNDHTGLILEFNKAYRRISLMLFFDSPTPTVRHGHDGTIFLTGMRNDDPYMITRGACVNPTVPRAIEIAVPLWIELLAKWEKNGYRVAIAIAPEKHGIYPEQLPLSVPRNFREACSELHNKPSITTELVPAAEERNLSVIYPYDEFYRMRYKGNFFPRENFHWGGLSAQYTATLVASALGLQLPDAYSRDRVTRKTKADTSGYLGFDLFFNQVIPDYGAFDVTTVNKVPRSVLKYYKKSWKPTGAYRTKNPITDRTALVFGNSFTKEIAYHLAPMYRDLAWAMTNTWDSAETSNVLPEIVKAVKPDDIIFVAHDAGMLRGNKLLPPISWQSK